MCSYTCVCIHTYIHHTYMLTCVCMCIYILTFVCTYYIHIHTRVWRIHKRPTHLVLQRVTRKRVHIFGEPPLVCCSGIRPQVRESNTFIHFVIEISCRGKYVYKLRVVRFVWLIIVKKSKSASWLAEHYVRIWSWMKTLHADHHVWMVHALLTSVPFLDKFLKLLLGLIIAKIAKSFPAPS